MSLPNCFREAIQQLRNKTAFSIKETLLDSDYISVHIHHHGMFPQLCKTILQHAGYAIKSHDYCEMSNGGYGCYTAIIYKSQWPEAEGEPATSESDESDESDEVEEKYTFTCEYNQWRAESNDCDIDIHYSKSLRS